MVREYCYLSKEVTYRVQTILYGGHSSNAGKRRICLIILYNFIGSDLIPSLEGSALMAQIADKSRIFHRRILPCLGKS